MGKPVIVDDGGSIRIRLALEGSDSVGEMDSLLKPGTNEHERDDSYTKALIFWLDKEGILSQQDIASFDTILISGDFGLDVEAKKINSASNPKLKLKVSSQTAEPIIESKQHKWKRSYNVVNGGRIKKIKVDGSPVLTLNDSDIYCCVVIT
jgi:hypothetical protein